MDSKIYTLMNEQVQKEFYSAYLYLDMANYYADEGLDGFANWFHVQAQEEMAHAMLFREYLLFNGQKVTLLPIDAPKGEYAGHDVPLKEALKHEEFVTASIHNIYDAALNAKDFRAVEFLNWFVKEQGEEEKNSADLIKKYELFAGGKMGLYQLDAELGTRVYAPPSLVLD